MSLVVMYSRARRVGGSGAREELDAAGLASAAASPHGRRSCTGRRGSRRLGRRPRTVLGQAAAHAAAQPRLGRGSGRAGEQPLRGGAAARGRAKAAATPRRGGKESGRAERARPGQTHGMAPRARGHRRAVRRSRLTGWGGGERERKQGAGVARTKAVRSPPPARRVASDRLGARRGNNHTAGYRKNRHSRHNQR